MTGYEAYTRRLMQARCYRAVGHVSPSRGSAAVPSSSRSEKSWTQGMTQCQAAPHAAVVPPVSAVRCIACLSPTWNDLKVLLIRNHNSVRTDSSPVGVCMTTRAFLWSRTSSPVSIST